MAKLRPYDKIAEGLKEAIAARREQKLVEALLGIIAHYDEFGARTTGMDMLLADCRKLVGDKSCRQPTSSAKS